MPRKPASPQVQVATRIRQTDLDAIDAIAAERGCSRFAVMQDVLSQTGLIRAALRRQDLAEKARRDVIEATDLDAANDLAAV